MLPDGIAAPLHILRQALIAEIKERGSLLIGQVIASQPVTTGPRAISNWFYNTVLGEDPAHHGSGAHFVVLDLGAIMPEKSFCDILDRGLATLR